MMYRITAGILVAVLCCCSTAEAASSQRSDLDDILRSKPDLVAGEQQYGALCSSCHGAAGEGKPGERVPRIAGQLFTVIADQLAGFRAGRRQDGRMQGRASTHVLPTPQDMANVAAYAAQLPGGVVERGPGVGLAAAAQLYASRCRECHGERAQGAGQNAVPRLASQNFSYLAQQLQDFVDGRRQAAAREHLQQLRSLDRDQLVGLADHLSRQP